MEVTTSSQSRDTEAVFGTAAASVLFCPNTGIA